VELFAFGEVLFTEFFREVMSASMVERSAFGSLVVVRRRALRTHWTAA
jgi:hypothetical protein